MRKSFWTRGLCGLMFFFGFGCLMYPQDLHLLKQWKHKADFGGEIYRSLLDEQDNLILVHRPGISMVNENQFVTFARWGQGPNEINGTYGMCEYHGDLAVFIHKNKIKLFRRNNNRYDYHSQKWLKSDSGSYYLKDAFFADNRFFLGGIIILEKMKSVRKGALLRIYNDKTEKIEGDYCGIQYPEPSCYHEIRKHFAVDGRYVYFLSQHEMKLYAISLDHIASTKTIELKRPDFYVSMPKDFFLVKNYKDDLEFFKDMESWYTSFSAVTRMAVLQGGYLVIQARACQPHLKKFALLFYNIGNGFSLDKIVYQDGLLLAGKADLLYCVHNGDPMVDEEANQVIIDIFRVVQ
ncbi:MAG: hypothetical protein PHH18_09505 [Acidobacteriota bacterium]|nr:hypothetical protein [Acidobacteriota bacterium]